MWRDDLIAAYQEAYDEFVAKNPGRPPRTWELDFCVEPELLRRACEAAANEIEHARYSPHPEAAAILLKVLLTDYLSDVRANRLWPTVATYLSTYSRHPLTSERVAAYFRAAIQRLHFRDLPNCHHRYVVFLMQDTGAGLHTDAIQEYLLGLVKAYRREPGWIDIDSFLEREKGKATADSEMELVSAALETASRALLRMVDYAVSHENSASPEGWAAHQEFWRQALGIELERLLPHAERRLMPALRYISKLSPKRAVHRSGRQSPVRVMVGNRPVSPGVVAVRRSGERMEIHGASQAPNVTPAVRVQRLVYGKKQSLYRLSGWPPTRSVAVEVDGFQWTVVNVQALELEVCGGRLVDGPVRIQGDRCIPYLGDSPCRVHLAGYFQGAEENWSLRGVMPTGYCELGHGTAYEVDGKNLGSGPLVLQLCFRNTPLPVTQVLYIFHESPIMEATRIGEHPVLKWQERDGTWIEVRGQHPVSLAAVQENKQALARYAPPSGGDWSLHFAWRPPIDDVWLEADDQPVPYSSTIKASAVERGLRLGFTHAAPLTRIQVNNRQVSDPEGVGEAVATALAEGHEEIGLTVECRGVTRQWSIEARPEVLSFSARWDVDHSLLGELSWRGSNRVPRVEANGLQAQVQSIMDCGPAGALGIHRYVAQVRWSEVISQGGDEVTVVWIQGNQQTVLQSLLLPDTLVNFRLRERVATLAQTSEEVNQAWELIYLNERFARLEGKLPASVDSQIASFQRRGCYFQDVFHCLRLLGSIIQETPVNTVPHPPEHFGPDNRSLVFYLTLLAVAQARLRARGLARPAVTEALVRAFERCRDDSTVGWWSQLMACYTAGYPPDECRSQLRGLDPPTVPLVLCASELREWLEAVDLPLNLSRGDEITRWTPSQS